MDKLEEDIISKFGMSKFMSLIRDAVSDQIQIEMPNAVEKSMANPTGTFQVETYRLNFKLDNLGKLSHSIKADTTYIREKLDRLEKKNKVNPGTGSILGDILPYGLLGGALDLLYHAIKGSGKLLAGGARALFKSKINDTGTGKVTKAEESTARYKAKIDEAKITKEKLAGAPPSRWFQGSRTHVATRDAPAFDKNTGKWVNKNSFNVRDNVDPNFYYERMTAESGVPKNKTGFIRRIGRFGKEIIVPKGLFNKGITVWAAIDEYNIARDEGKSQAQALLDSFGTVAGFTIANLLPVGTLGRFGLGIAGAVAGPHVIDYLWNEFAPIIGVKVDKKLEAIKYRLQDEADKRNKQVRMRAETNLVSKFKPSQYDAASGQMVAHQDMSNDQAAAVADLVNTWAEDQVNSFFRSFRAKFSNAPISFEPFNKAFLAQRRKKAGGLGNLTKAYDFITQNNPDPKKSGSIYVTVWTDVANGEKYLTEVIPQAAPIYILKFLTDGRNHQVESRIVVPLSSIPRDSIREVKNSDLRVIVNNFNSMKIKKLDPSRPSSLDFTNEDAHLIKSAYTVGGDTPSRSSAPDSIGSSPIIPGFDFPNGTSPMGSYLSKQYSDGSAPDYSGKTFTGKMGSGGTDTTTAAPSNARDPVISGSGDFRSNAEKYLGRKMSDTEFDALKRIVTAESGHTNPKEVAMVMGSVLNRAKNGNTTIMAVVRAKGQFMGYGTGAYNSGPNASFSALMDSSSKLLAGVPRDQVNFRGIAGDPHSKAAPNRLGASSFNTFFDDTASPYADTPLKTDTASGNKPSEKLGWLSKLKKSDTKSADAVAKNETGISATKVTANSVVDDYLYQKYLAAGINQKDVAAAKKAGMSLKDFVIGGVDAKVKLNTYTMGKKMDAQGLEWGISGGFRDLYRQQLVDTSGPHARPGVSQHGGGTATYGAGKAFDITAIGKTDKQTLWNWIDQNGPESGLGRPYGDKDHPHVGPIFPGSEYARKRGDPATMNRVASLGGYDAITSQEQASLDAELAAKSTPDTLKGQLTDKSLDASLTDNNTPATTTNKDTPDVIDGINKRIDDLENSVKPETTTRTSSGNTRIEDTRPVLPHSQENAKRSAAGLGPLVKEPAAHFENI